MAPEEKCIQTQMLVNFILLSTHNYYTDSRNY